MSVLKRLLFVCGLLVVLPASAFAQASITGVVKDVSGAVLPGVTVEAASPELIEKVRSAVTDGSGQYRIVDLRPGTYSVTFSLTGFSSVKREGVELTGSFTASINADMKVGGLAETITVTGETPIVDVQSVRRQNNAEQRAADDGADGAVVGGHRGAVSRDHHSGRHQRGHPGHAADDRVRRRRRPHQRRPHAGGRSGHRRRAERRRRLDLRRRHLQRAGSRDDELRRDGRGGSRRAGA